MCLQLALEPEDLPEKKTTLLSKISNSSVGISKKTKAVEQEQVFQDQLLSKMSKTMDLVARLDAYNTGDNQTRVSKLLGYLFIPHVDFLGFPQSCFHKLAL